MAGTKPAASEYSSGGRSCDYSRRRGRAAPGDTVTGGTESDQQLPDPGESRLDAAIDCRHPALRARPEVDRGDRAEVSLVGCRPGDPPHYRACVASDSTASSSLPASAHLPWADSSR